MTRTWATAAAVLLFPALALGAAPDAGTPSAEGASALIYGGGKTQEDAQRWLEDFAKTLKVVPALKPADGFPKVMKSEAVAGLKPGFFIVLLGYCLNDELDPALDAAKAMYAGAYYRPVSFVSSTCPKPQGDLSGDETVTLPDKSTVRLVHQPPEDDKVVDAAGTLLFVLRGPDGLLRDSTGMPNSWHLYDTPHTACSATAGVEKNRMVIDNVCESGRYRSFVNVSAGKLQIVDEKHPQLEVYDQ